MGLGWVGWGAGLRGDGVTEGMLGIEGWTEVGMGIGRHEHPGGRGMGPD